MRAASAPSVAPPASRYDRNMRQHPRVRRIAKWSGIGVCASVLAAWGGSELRYVSVGPICAKIDLEVRGGSLILYWWDQRRESMKPQWTVERLAWGVHFWLAHDA